MTKEPPKGPIKWMRRRLLPAGAKFAALGGLCLLVLWIVGRVLTDQYQWSQFLWWVPPIWAVGSAWILLAVSAVLGKFSLRTGGMILRPILTLACIGCSVFVVLGIWRMHRVFNVVTPVAGPATIRVLHWNQSAYNTKDKAVDFIVPVDADLVLIVNARRNQHRTSLIRALDQMAPSEEDERLYPGVRANFKPNHATIQGDALVLSRFPIIHTGTTWLDNIVDSEETSRPAGQRGWIMFVELDLSKRYPDGPSSMVVWIVDLPSEPMLWRMTSMQAAVNAVNKWNGVYRVSDGNGNWTAINSDDPFPEPDLVIGDFNTIRGSASLDTLAPATKDAFAQAGHGRAGSWSPRIGNKFLRQPFKLSEWHIDLALTGHRWSATNYRLINSPVGPHKMQVLDIEPVNN
ncbi:MAG: hypothetical protein JKY96_01970 [Phycisphaerales bacterium]|nr:hypothetical protein [Phycisphaerales bacterium]